MIKNISTKAFTAALSAKAYMKKLSDKAAADMASDKKGQAILEYAVLFVAVGLGLVMAVKKLRSQIETKLNNAGQELTGV